MRYAPSFLNIPDKNGLACVATRFPVIATYDADDGIAPFPRQNHYLYRGSVLNMINFFSSLHTSYNTSRMAVVTQPEAFFFKPTNYVPNSQLPVLLYRKVLPFPLQENSVKAFLESNNWVHGVSSEKPN